MVSKILKQLFLIIGIGAFAVYFYQQRESLKDLPWNHHLGALLGLLILWVGLHAAANIPWFLLLRCLSPDITLLEALEIKVRSIPSKFVPGKVAGVMSLYLYGENVGIPKRGMTAAIYLETLFLLVTAFITYLVFTVSSWTDSGLYLLLSLGFSTLGILLLTPGAFKFLEKKILKTGDAIPYDFKVYIQILVFRIMLWLAVGLAFWIFVWTITGKALPFFFSLGVPAVSWAIGFLAVITPSGFGVSELTSAIHFKDSLKLPVILSLTLGFRILLQLSEWLWYLLFLTLIRLREKK